MLFEQILVMSCFEILAPCGRYHLSVVVARPLCPEGMCPRFLLSVYGVVVTRRER